LIRTVEFVSTFSFVDDLALVSMPDLARVQALALPLGVEILPHHGRLVLVVMWVLGHQLGGSLRSDLMA